MTAADGHRQNGPVDRCTTERQNAHGTEAVVCYRWHPWYGLTVRKVKTVSKRLGNVLHVSCEREEQTRLREIPAWMVDAAACASMRLADIPRVDCRALHRLRELIESCVGDDKQGVVEKQHHNSSRKGDADANRPTPRPAHSTRSVSNASDTAAMEDTATGDPAASSADAGATAQGTSRRKTGVRQRKGGVR